MVSKVIVSILLVCAIQHTQSVEKRFMFPSIGEVVNASVTQAQNMLAPIETGIKDGLTKAEELVKNATSMAQQVVTSTVTTIQQQAQNFASKVKSDVDRAVETGKNVSTCVLGQGATVANIVRQAGADVSTCTQGPIQAASDVADDLKSLGDLIGQLMSSIPSQMGACVNNDFFNALNCLGQSTANATSRAWLLTSSLTSDAATVVSLGLQMPGQIVKCGTDEIAKVAAQFATMLSTFNTCIKNGPQTS